MACVLRRSISRLRGDQSGFTLIELLIGSTLSLVIAFAAMNFSEIATGSHDRTADRAEALGTARVGLERMTRELRQGTDPQALSGGAAVDVLEVGGGERVQYDCSQEGECRRYSYPVGDTPGAYEVVIEDVQTPASFTVEEHTYPPDTVPVKDYIQVDLVVDVPDHAPVSLSSGVHLPNQVGG